MKTGTKLGLIALFLAVGTTAFWFYLTREVRIPEDRTPFVVVFVGSALLGVFAFFKGTSILGALPPIVAVVLGLFLPFTMSISAQSVDDSSVIAVGDTLPPFSALTGQGESFDSATLSGELVLIKFFRGHW